MAKKLSDQTRLSPLSGTTGISTSDLKKILDGTYPTRQPFFDKNPPPQFQKSISSPPIRQKSVLERIQENEEISELWSILSGLSYDQPEFLPCYEKLVKRAKEDANDTEDTDDLENILNYIPSGSPEEKEVINKATEIEKGEINSSDFDELVDMYENRSLYSSTKKHLIEKMLTVASTPEETNRLIDEVFPEGSLEYYEAIKRHREIVLASIACMRSTDDSDNIAQYIEAGAEEEIFLAKKIVEIGTTASDILDRKDDFKDGSEAQEILELGAIEMFTDYENDKDDLDNIIGDWSEASRVERAAIAKKRELLIKHAEALTNTEDMKDLLDEFEDGDPEKKKLEERIIELTNDLDELNEFENDDNEYLELLARTKIDRLILESINGATGLGTIENYENYVEKEGTEECALDEKRVELCNSKDDADNIADEIRSNSYAVYLLAKKFNRAAVTPVEEATVEEPVLQQEEERTRKDEEDTEMNNKISKNNSLETAIEIYNSLPHGDINKEFAYTKAVKLLNEKLQYSHNSKEKVAGFLKLFPEGTAEWVKIIQKLAEYYPKPWYVLWQ